MSVRGLLVVAAVAAGVTLFGIVAVDAPAARALAQLDPASPGVGALAAALAGLDVATGMTLPCGTLAGAAIVLGGALWWWRRDAGRALLVIGLVHAVARVLAGHLKPALGRLRPADALARHQLDDTFFHDGVAFPSGHAGHYAALALAALALWPRARAPAVAVLSVALAARLARNAHFVSDLAASVALAALAAAGALVMLPAQPRGEAGLRPPPR